MIDVHPPHTATHTWKDFFIHMAAICLGLLIAIGLEQSVEYFHHRQQVADLRQEFEAERRANAVHFDAGVAEWRRFAPLVQGNLRTLAYLRDHPGAPPSKWPDRMSWYMKTFTASNAAWKTAQESAALQYMSRPEVQQWGSFYSQLDDIAKESSEERDGVIRAKAFLQQGPALEQLTPGQLEKEQDIWLDVMAHFARLGNAMRNFSHAYPEFKNPPTDDEFYSVIPPAPDPQDVQAVRVLREAEERALKQIEDQADAHSAQQP